MSIQENEVMISVIMGIYNCAGTLSEAIESILNQTITNWELIMCDDGSTDDTYNVAKEFEIIRSGLKSLSIFSIFLILKEYFRLLIILCNIFFNLIFIFTFPIGLVTENKFKTAKLTFSASSLLHNSVPRCGNTTKI